MKATPQEVDESREIQAMFAALARGPKETLPSKYWEALIEKNLRELDERGYENFKRTIARTYFMDIVKPNSAQLKALRRFLPLGTFLGCALKTLTTPKQDLLLRDDWNQAPRLFRLFGINALGWFMSWSYAFLTRLLNAHADRMDTEGVFGRLFEPLEGNPPRVHAGKRLLSQDLANSFLEYRTVMQPHGTAAGVQTVIELGAGYGRDAYVFLSAHPEIRYIVADIPPALYLAQRYLSSQFKDRKIFKFRDFRNYGEIKAEFEAANVAFLTPNQLCLLPDKTADLFVNISSLHEMRPDQIEYYFGQIDRLTRKLFYTKQWKVGVIPKENIVIKEGDYPVRPGWKELLHRDCPLRPSFFEALYQLG